MLGHEPGVGRPGIAIGGDCVIIHGILSQVLFDEPGIGRPSELWLLRVEVHRPRPARPLDGDNVPLCTQVYTLTITFSIHIFSGFLKKNLQTSGNQDDIYPHKIKPFFLDRTHCVRGAEAILCKEIYI